MADYLRYTRPGAANPQRGRLPSYVAGLDEMEEDAFPVAPPNLSGRTERDTPPEPETPNEEGGQAFQLAEVDMVPDLGTAPRAGGDLRLPGDLAAPQQQLRPPMQGNSRLSFVAGLEPSPQANEDMPQAKGSQWDPELAQRALMASQDRDDQAASARARRARIGIAIAGGLGGIFGNTTQAQVAQAAAANDPNAPFEARRASRAAEAEAQAAQARAGIDEEERAMNTRYREALIRSMDTNADRRLGEMERTGARDARNYDPESAQAAAAREMLRRAVASAPADMRAAFEGIDIDSLGAREIEGMTDRVLRRIGQVPMRERTTEQSEIMAAVAANGATPADDAEVIEEPAAPVRTGATRRASAPGEVVAEDAAPVRRDRDLDGIIADILAERSGQPTSTGQPARSFTPRERQVVARSMRSSRTRGAAQLAGGLGTTGQEAQFAQVGQQGAFTETDLRRASEALAPLASQARQMRRVVNQANALSEAQFQVAMRDSAALSRLMGGYNVERFGADFRALTNSQLREQSGAAVTDSEAQRFFSALSARSFTSKAAFVAALNRAIAETRANADLLGIRPDVRAAWRARVQGGQ